MKTIEEINAAKIPIIQIDESLAIYKNKILFPQKLEKANATLKKLGLPKRKMRKKIVISS
jgi:hypothetical protein